MTHGSNAIPQSCPSWMVAKNPISATIGAPGFRAAMLTASVPSHRTDATMCGPCIEHATIAYRGAEIIARLSGCPSSNSALEMRRSAEQYGLYSRTTTSSSATSAARLPRSRCSNARTNRSKIVLPALGTTPSVPEDVATAGLDHEGASWIAYAGRVTRPDVATPELDMLLALYDRTHGVPRGDIRPEPVAGTPEGRRGFWRAVWRALGFHTTEPTGSSRLLEVAWALASAGGSPADMLLALHGIVADDLPLSTAYEALLKELWIPARCEPERFATAFDFLGPIPDHQTRRQAYLVLRFARDANRYSTAELERLRTQLAGATGQQCELWLDDVLGPQPPRDAISQFLARVVELVAASDGFIWCTWDDRTEALAELRRAEEELSEGGRPTTLQVLFLPTGDLQEVSMESGWSDEYIALADRFDRALVQLGPPGGPTEH